MNLILILWKNSPLNWRELSVNSYDKLDLRSISDSKQESNSLNHIRQLKGEKKELEEKLKAFGLMTEELNQLRQEKEADNDKLEALIAQIEKLGI